MCVWKVLIAQSCLTLQLHNCSPPGSSVPGILQARILERVAIPFCRRSSGPRDQTQVSCIASSLFTVWAIRETPHRPAHTHTGFPGGASGKESNYQWGDTGDTHSIPGLGRSPGGGYGNSLQYSCLENPMDRRAWRAKVQSVAKSQTLLKQLSMHI